MAGAPEDDEGAVLLLGAGEGQALDRLDLAAVEDQGLVRGGALQPWPPPRATWPLIPQRYACAYPFGSMQGQIDQRLKAARAYGRAVLPAGPLYGRGTTGGQGDVATLIAAARAHNLPGVLWWRYGVGTEGMLRQAATAAV